MTIKRLLILSAVPVAIAAFGFVTSSQSNANQSNNLVAQNSSPPNGQQQQPRRQPPRIDFAAAAQKLGVTEAQLKEALGVPAEPPSEPPTGNPPPRPDIKGAAEKLGVTEQQLIEALGIPPHPPGDCPDKAQ